jgi:hypothetical protein
MSRPSTNTRPALGVSSPATILSRVVFPHPDGPRKHTSSPDRTWRSTPVTASTGP